MSKSADHAIPSQQAAEKKAPKVVATNGKSYRLANGEQSKTQVLKGKTEGKWHYYAPKKVTVKHEVAQQEAVQPILDLITSGKFWKIRLWTLEGIHSAKTFEGKTSLLPKQKVVKVTGVKEKSNGKPKAVPPSKEGSKPVGKLQKAPSRLKEATELANAVE